MAMPSRLEVCDSCLTPTRAAGEREWLSPSSMSRFAPQAFLRPMAEDERVGDNRAARDTRAVLLALDWTLPTFLTEQLHSELASLWAALTHPQVASAPQLSGDVGARSPAAESAMAFEKPQ